jgi:hypothetical protein
MSMYYTMYKQHIRVVNNEAKSKSVGSDRRPAPLSGGGVGRGWFVLWWKLGSAFRTACSHKGQGVLSIPAAGIFFIMYAEYRYHSCHAWQG